MKIIVSGGRTGGHLIPGIAIYKELKNRDIQTHYVMSTFDLKYPVTSNVEETDRVLLDVKNISRKISFKTPFYLVKILLSFFKVFKIIKDFNPDVTIITGGYISNPIALSSILLGKPLYIVEQNSVSGITNRFYARFAEKVFTAFPITKKIPDNKAVLTGNPSIFNEKLDKKKARRYFNIDNYENIIGIIGGSQGSKVINNIILELLPWFIENNTGVLWSLGSVDYKRMEENGKIKEISELYQNVKLFQFIEKMDYFYSAVDLIISRAGATSISEFIKFEIIAIMVPIKNSPDDHQYLNARFLSDENAGFIIEEDDLNKQNLIKTIDFIIINHERHVK